MKKYHYLSLCFYFLSTSFLLAQTEYFSVENVCLEEEFYYEMWEQEQAAFEIKAPLATLQVPTEAYQIDARFGRTIQPSPGTKIEIPAHAFLDGEGKVVKGTIEVQYREFKKPMDIFLSGIPMTVETEAGQKPFQSAGMFELKASQNGTEVYPNPQALIEVEMASLQVDENFDLYTLDETNGNWNNEGQRDLLTQLINQEDFTEVSSSWWRQSVDKPQLNYGYLNIYTLGKHTKPKRRNTIKDLQFVIRAEGAEFLEAIEDSMKLEKKYQDLVALKNMIWVYDGENRSEASRQIREVFQRNAKYRYKVFYAYQSEAIKKASKKITRDIIVEANPEGDNYLIKIVSDTETITIPAYPYMMTTSPVVEQKRNVKFHQKLSKNFELRLAEWKRLDEIYAHKMKVYSEKMEALGALEKEYEADSDLRSDDGRFGSQNYTKRRVSVRTFGVCNIDRIMRSIDTERELMVDMGEKQNLEIESVFVLDDTNNAVLNYPGTKIRFAKKGKNSLILLSKNGLIGMVAQEDFAQALKQGTEKKLKVSATFVSPEMISRESLSNALAMN